MRQYTFYCFNVVVYDNLFLISRSNFRLSKLKLYKKISYCNCCGDISVGTYKL
jgi:hypothetical protein